MRALVAAIVAALALPAVSLADETVFGVHGAEQQLFAFSVIPSSGGSWQGSSYSASSRCLKLFGNTETEVDTVIDCSAASNVGLGGFTLSRDVVLTRMSVVRQNALTSDSTADLGGCAFILATGNGSTQIASTELESPPEAGAAAVGEIEEVTFGERIAKGTTVNILVKNGGFCAAASGASCVCDEEWGQNMLTISGVPQ